MNHMLTKSEKPRKTDLLLAVVFFSFSIPRLAHHEEKMIGCGVANIMVDHSARALRPVIISPFIRSHISRHITSHLIRHVEGSGIATEREIPSIQTHPIGRDDGSFESRI